MKESAATVLIVDDDASVREAVRSLLASVGLPARAFGTTEEFLRAKTPTVPSCLVLDVRLPGMNGLEFQERLAEMGNHIPIVFITAHGDIPMTSRAIRGGAVEFLTKPFQKDEFLAAVHQALDRDRAQRKEQAKISVLQSRHAKLTRREREVMEFVVTGLINKEIAAKLGLSEITVKVHRGQAMKKMEADSLADLVRMAEVLHSQSHE
jgi:FixJ family two-component response regulator